ncbi:hypothetical protein F5X99DRAFT_378815 [Biscogniauxia marginata]|nr:hypothetical protein F5X99DRAFT_378815 [Biscogniauxia marginata]
MVPPALKGTYGRYKQDTDYIAAWLCSRAEGLGFSAVGKPAASSSVEGKARTQAKPKYLISKKGWITFAEYIATKAAPVPSKFKTTIDRTIDVRSNFGSKLEENGEVISEEDDDKHQNFVGVLRKVREILTPFMRLDDADPIAYEANKAQDDMAIYEAEPEASSEDAIFALMVTIEDMDKVRTHVQWIWSNYKTGIFDLAAAAIATNTAIELVKNTMEDILPLLKKHGGIGHMLEMFYVLQCEQRGWKEKDLMMAGKDDFNYATYNIANDTYFMAYQLLQGFAAILQSDQLPLYKPGSFGCYDPASDRSRKTRRQKFEDDRALLTPFLSELMIIIHHVDGWPVEDEFLRGMKELDETKEVPFYLVFAAQVFLDITYELGGAIQRPFTNLIDHISFIHEDLESYFEIQAELKIENRPVSNDYLMRDLQYSIDQICEDLPHTAQIEIYRRGNIEAPNTESHRIFRLSPIVSGLMLYYFRYRYREAGLAAAHAWKSIQSCEYLYSVLRREKLLRGTWTDMDVLRTCVEEESFYRDAALASKEGPCVLEGSPVLTMFKARYVDNGSDIEITPEYLGRIIELSMFEKEGSKENGTLMMGQIEDPEKLKEKKKLRQQQDNRRSYKATEGYIYPEQLIESLVFALSNESFEFSFPYLCMHRWCWWVLSDALLEQPYNPTYLERESQLPFVVGWVRKAADGTQSRASDRQLLLKAAETLNEFIQSEAADFITTKVLEQRLGKPVQFRFEDNHKDENEASDRVRYGP